MPQSPKNSGFFHIGGVTLVALQFAALSCAPSPADHIENETPRLKYGEMSATLNCLDSGVKTPPQSTTPFEVSGCNPHSVENLEFEKPPSAIDVTPLCRDGQVKVSSDHLPLTQTLMMDADGNFNLEASMALTFTDKVERPGPCSAQFKIRIHGRAFCRSANQHDLARVELHTEWENVPKLNPSGCPTVTGCHFATSSTLSCPSSR